MKKKEDGAEGPVDGAIELTHIQMRSVEQLFGRLVVEGRRPRRRGLPLLPVGPVHIYNHNCRSWTILYPVVDVAFYCLFLLVVVNQRKGNRASPKQEHHSNTATTTAAT
jgi:hypothetical protein